MSSETRSRSPIDPEIVRELADILRPENMIAPRLVPLSA